MDNYITEEFIIGQSVLPNESLTLVHRVFDEKAKVFLNGVRQHSSAYEITDNELTFNDCTVMNDVVIIDYWF